MAALSLAGCSDDENGNGGNGGNGGSGEGGNPSGGDLTEILFEDGTQIGDGRQEFEIKGDYTLPKGTYLLKGWCYIADGASLTLAPGTIIKGDKETKAALIVEPGGQLWAKGTQSEPIVFTSEMPAGNRRPGDWGGIILCGRGVNNKGLFGIVASFHTIAERNIFCVPADLFSSAGLIITELGYEFCHRIASSRRMVPLIRLTCSSQLSRSFLTSSPEKPFDAAMTFISTASSTATRYS